MPSASAPLLDRRASFGSSATPWDAIEVAMSSGVEEKALAQVWISVAHSCPPLARRLVRSVAYHPAYSTLDRLKSFSRKPNWRRLALSLVTLDVGDSPTDHWRIARLASAVAEKSGWCDPQAAYWDCLCSNDDLGPCLDAVDLQTFEPTEQCRIVARWLVDAVPDFAPSLESVYSCREATAALDSLPQLFDVASILSEVDVHGQSPLLEMSQNACRRLECLAHLAAYRREEVWRDRLEAIGSALNVEQALEITGGLLGDWMGERWGIWLQAHGDREGLARWVLPGSTRQILGCNGSREELERTMLPACYRSSRDLTSNSGAVFGRVYSEEPYNDDTLSQWIHRLGHSLKEIVKERELDVTREQFSARFRRVSGEIVQRHDDRLRAAIGEFSAGAGHEINNPLGAIAGHAARLLREESDPDRRHSLQQISAQTDRIRRMIRDLQLIGGQRSLDGRIVAISQILERAASKAEEKLASGRRTFESCDDDWRVRGDESLLVRMLAEIVVNGAQAAGPGGHVNVRVERSEEDEPAYEIIVTDTGPGFSPVERQRARVPYYSGREAGRGLGMGLSVADRIARDHGGAITIGYSRPTTLRVLLPAA